MHLLTENKEAKVTLEYDPEAIRPYGVASENKYETFKALGAAFQYYQEEAARALTLATPALDLEAVTLPFKCQTDDGRTATVLIERRTEVNDATYVVLVDHGSSKNWESNDELVFLSDRVGHMYFSTGTNQTGNYLTPLPPPKPIVKEGWLNLYKRQYATSPGAHSQVWETKAEAQAMTCNNGTYVGTAKVTWEE